MNIKSSKIFFRLALTFAPRSFANSLATMPIKMKGYAFGYVGNHEQPPSSPTSFGGTVLAYQPIASAIYKENVQDFQSAFVYEFPSVEHAKDWYSRKKESTLVDDEGPMVVLEAEQLGAGYQGFSIFFIKVHDKEKFSRYNPSESLASYPTKRVAAPVNKAPVVTKAAGKFDNAVLIGFSKPGDGKKWLESDEYAPHGELRLSTTSGHGIVTGSDRVVE